jgi:superfamily I DNA/RNA helicase
MSVSQHRNAGWPPFRTSPSAIARYFFHDCERFLRFHSASPQTRKREGLPTPQFDHSPLVKAILESGYLWEEAVLDKHLGESALVAPGDGPPHTRRFDWHQTLRLIRGAEPGTFIYQPTLRLPRAFYERHGIDPKLVVISDNHPDLIAVLDDGRGGRLLRVLDLKRGEALHLTHRVQVLIYALELEAILWAESIGALSADLQQGEVWLGAQPAPTPFDLTDVRPHLEDFLRHDLVRILRAAAADANWHMHFRCEWCEFFEHCRDDMRARDDVSRLSHLTSYGKQFLRQEGRVQSVSDLGTFLKRDDADDVLSRCASLAGRRPRLAQQVAALQANRPQPHGAASLSLSKGENVGLFLTLQQEPLTQSVYLAGIHLTLRKDLRDKVFSPDVAERFFQDGRAQPLALVARDPADVPRIRREWVRVLCDVVTQLDRYNQKRSWRDQLSLQAYVLSEQERELLIHWLLETLHDAEQPDLAERAVTLLFHFQAPELMVADSHPDREVPFPIVVLLDALGHVLALPLEVSYTLPESLESLGSRFRYRRNDYYHFPLGHGLRAEPIHAAWHRGKTELLPEIEEATRTYLRAVRELLQSVRHHGSDAIFAWASKFALPAREEYPDPLLSRLAFFARYESLLDCLSKRHGRCEPHAVQLLLGNVMQLRALDGADFEIVKGAAMPVDPHGFPEWLLVSDDEAGRQAQLEYRDYACRRRLWQGKPQSNLAVVGVSDIRRDKYGVPTGLTIEYAKPFADDPPAAGRRYLLHPRFTDYTTDGVVAFLHSYDDVMNRMGGSELFLPLLRDPVAACRMQPLPEKVSAPAAELTDRLRLTASQAEAYRSICQTRVVPVWGPPGTGKTHFLATVILGLATAHARAGQPFRVLVTAFTHAAIENLLRKVIVLKQTLGLAEDLHVGKAKAWHGDDGVAAEVIDPARLPEWLSQQPRAVVGATVYSSLKSYGDLPEFDLVVIDEASQVRVPEAAIPVSLVGQAGRLVLAGDHLQLPPIVSGVYPEPPPGDPVLHRSIFEVVAGQRGNDPADSAATLAGPGVKQLTENFRMNDVLTSFAAGLLYGPDYRPFDDAVASRRLDLLPERCLDPFVETCLDPKFPLVVVLLDGVWAARENPLEAHLVARLVTGLRGTLRAGDGRLYTDDDDFFRSGVFLVSPHRAQIRLIDRELRRQRMWERPPFVDTVDKMQGQEADAVIVSYGVSDPEFAVQEAEFIYGLNRLNVAVTRARAKCVVFLPRPLLNASPQVLDRPQAIRGVAFMRDLVASAARCGEGHSFELDEGASAEVFRVAERLQPSDSAPETGFGDDAQLRELVDDTVPDRPVAAKSGRAGRKRTAKKPRRASPGSSKKQKASEYRGVGDAEGVAGVEPRATSGELAVRETSGGSLRSTPATRSRSEDETPQEPTQKKESSVTKSRKKSAAKKTAAKQAGTENTTAKKPAKRQASAKKTTARKQTTGKVSAKKTKSPPKKKPRKIPAVLVNLNPQQCEAAMHGDDPLLIIAGAGTGKTTTLVHRVAYLISQGVPPQRVLLLTFTRRAAAEMLYRVADVLGQRDVSRRVWGGTFHAVGARLLRSHGRKIGVDPRFSIHDRGDSESLMQVCAQDLGLAKGDKKFPKKGTCVSIHSYMVNAQRTLDETLQTQFSSFARYAEPLEKLFAAYAERKTELNVFDYDDLLRKWCDLMESGETGPAIRERFDCVLVDEYQDTNRLQSRLLQGLRPDGRGLTVVGDDAQSIYSFRAATVRNILDFPDHFPDTRVVALEQNYRSPEPILAASNRVIAEASDRYTKDLWSDRAEGPRPQLVTCEDEHEQVDFVVKRILDHRRRGIPLSQQAVLFRAAHHSILLEGDLTRQRLPYAKYGGLKFVESAHVKDLMAFLRLAENPRDRIAGQRVLTLLPGIGPKKADQLHRALAESGGQFAAWNDAKPPSKADADWPQLVSLLGHLAGEKAAGDLSTQIGSVMTFYEPLMEGRYENLPQRLEDLQELQELAGRFEDRATMLTELALDPPDGTDTLPPGEADRDRLVLSTMHSAKGLEWKVVYVLHASDGKIPLERSLHRPEQVEEERRLFYVAMTRAADWLYICHPRRQSSSYGSGWLGDVYERTELTRFITSSAKREFECQTARTFRLPAESQSDQPKKKRRGRQGVTGLVGGPKMDG